MLTLTNTKTRKLKYLSHLLWEYSFYLCQELRNPTAYLISLVIGRLVAWLMQTSSIIPLLVSCIVLIAANAIQQFKNSDIKTLLLLPAHREDPAFIMDLDGKVVLSAGKTDRLFQKESISNINYTSASAFYQKYRFDDRVRSFLDVPIQNFINYPAVNTYSRFIAGKLGFDSKFVETIGRVAALHDIGKVAIPDLIKLPKAYSRDQRLKMQMHTIIQRLCGVPS